MMIIYPQLQKGMTIGSTAPSSGVGQELHGLLHQAAERMAGHGYPVVYGDTVWTQDKAKSAAAAVRAAEFMRMMQDAAIGLIVPPWGGELLIEIVEHLDYAALPAKWVLGYSDISLLLLAITLNTGIATAHGANLIDLRGEEWDETTGKWEQVLSTLAGGEVVQYSSPLYQKEWNHEHPSPQVFHLNESTVWKTALPAEKDGNAEKNGNADRYVSAGETGGKYEAGTTTQELAKVEVEGRLLGGCIDVIRHLIGTPYGDVAQFRRKHLQGEPILWYLENCELNTADVRRSLVQMKLAGWFVDTSAILFGRSSGNQPVQNYMAEDIYRDLAVELGVPVIYDIDCGHVPPQLTLINGAYAKVTVENGKGTLWQQFKP